MKNNAAVSGALVLALLAGSSLSAQASLAAQSSLSTPSRPGSTGQGSEAELLDSFHSISSNELLAWVEEMSSPRYRGRLPGSPEYMQVAQWVADHLESWGIAPAGEGGTYFQTFDMPYSEVKGPGSLSLSMAVEGDTLVLTYRFPEDYFPGTNSDSGTVTGDVVYVGYGATAPELGYDDYEGVDVAGKIVVIESGVPYSGDDEETAARWVPYSYHQEKLDNARKHGAVGLLYVGKTANPNTSFNRGLVYCHIDLHVADHLFLGTGTSRQEVMERIRSTMEPVSIPLLKSATLTAETERHPDGITANVLGMIEGSDPVLKDEVIIVGGHLDAVGYLGAVMPGALDNASGVADIMGAAKALAMSPVKPARSVLFLFIGGEESGLLGSAHYTTHPVFPKEKTVVFFNLDMVGHGTGLSVGGGVTYPQIFGHFERANEAYIHRPMRTSAVRVSSGRPRSDSVIFQRAGFRTMSFGTTGSVPGIPTYYHDPRDTPQTLTPEIMEDVSKLMYIGLLGLANDHDLQLDSSRSP